MYDEPELSKISEEILKDRYLLDGENVKDLFVRVAEHVAKDKEEAEEFYNVMSKGEFMPNSPTLFNAGTDNPMLSACFVLPINDDTEDIFDTMKEAALIQKYGGGVGFNFSNLRREGAKIEGTGGTSSGPVSFIKMYDEMIETIKQGGKRRGAAMAMMNYDHPDIMKFIRAKTSENDITNFNMSVGVDETFMKAIINEEEIELVGRKSGEIVDTIDAREMYDEMIKGMYDNGEPGMIYLDNINEDNKANKEINAVNPCIAKGEKVLTKDGNKNIEDVNIGEMVMTSDGWNKVLNKWDKGIKDTVIVNTKNSSIECTPDHEFLTEDGNWIEAINLKGKNVIIKDKDNNTSYSKVLSVEESNSKRVFDLNVEEEHNFVVNNTVVSNCGEIPLLPYEACNLGHINLSEVVEYGRINWDKLEELVETGVRFLDNVIDVNDFPIEKITKNVKKYRRLGLGVMGLHEALIKMGIPYETQRAKRKSEEISEFINKKAKEVSKELAKEKGTFPAWEESEHEEEFRNVAVTAVAPTGTTSIIADTTPSIEPAFQFKYEHHANDGVYQRKIKGVEMRVDDMDDLPDDKLYNTALDIDPIDHVDMQTVWQDNIDNAISKTINLPEDYPVEDLYDIPIRAWENGAKGLTVYRNNSRNKQVMVEDGDEEVDVDDNELEFSLDYEREDVCPECGEELEMIEGCETCPDCGWSKCSV